MYVDSSERIPIKVWAEPGSIEESCIDQARNLARLPFALSHIALMPDTHTGYGMPVGGVLFADKAVVPYAVGVDIGCGVALIETDLKREDIDAAGISRFLAQVARDVPVGNGPQAEHRTPVGEPWSPPGEAGPYVDEVFTPSLLYADKQLGTLGGGNHFLELQASEDGRIWFMLHSGSRSLGKKVCDYWHKAALAMNDRWHSQLPHRELAYLPAASDEFQGYWADMTGAMLWAEENRRRMAGKVVAAFGKVFGATAFQVRDTHHNYAAWEAHHGQNGIVHRKGAVRARAGEGVLIPGSMGTASYAAEGLGNEASFQTCQHGAGRARSRGATRKATTLEAMEATLVDAGVQLVTPNRSDVIDESPIAYKDIEAVMAQSADLVTATMRLVPLGVVKG